MKFIELNKKKIRVYAVVPYEQWDYVKNNENEKQYLNDYDYWQEYDYSVTAIMVEESLVFLDDNIHSNPYSVLDGVVIALEKFFPLEKTKEVLLLDEGVYEYNKTKVQEAIYNKWKSEN
jgi:hypothetical protein